MKKTIIILFFLLGSNQIFAQQLPKPLLAGNKLSIRFHKNIELLGFAYFIAFEGKNSKTKLVTVNGQEMLEKDWQNYGYWFYERYQRYQHSSHLANALAVTEYLWLSHIIPLLLNVEDFPNAKITPDLDESFYLAFSTSKNVDEARKNATLFLSACNEFYKEVHFDNFLAETEHYYDAAAEQIKLNLPNSVFTKEMEAFYRKKFAHYELVPSLTLPKGMGFSAPYGNDGNRTICNVFGAVAMTKFKDVKLVDMGFAVPHQLRELSIHEFGHAFVNPAVNMLPASKFKESEVLFAPIKAVMEEQGYNTWQSCLSEHLVRAVEIVIAERMGNQASAAALRQSYIVNRKFIYIPMMIDELKKYANNPKSTLNETVMDIMEKLNGM